jgi:LL-diaminopimelate aminotransferase
MEIPGAKEIGIEFHSFSKTFNMTGWRLGFAVGNPALVAGLLRVKTNIDSGPLLAVQEGGQFALKNYETLVPPLRDIYRERRTIALNGLKEMGIEFFSPDATFFVWAKVPKGKSSMEFTKELIQTQGLVVTPGIGFGEQGEGFFRLSLTVKNDSIVDALNRMKGYLRTI